LFPADEATFNRLRYVEIKHGRVAQLASDTLSLLLYPSPRKHQPRELFADILMASRSLLLSAELNCPDR
jgi:hypothetical protein